MHPPLVLLTDFGLGDPYLGQLKGVLATLAPTTPVIDLCHHVEPFNAAHGAWMLAASRAHFPAGAIFLAVVDPGVGGPRRLILVSAHGQLFLGPDNGLLWPVARADAGARAWDVTPGLDYGPDYSPERGPNAGVTPGPGATRADTFHGRDVLAPLAARLALGERPDTLGPEIAPSTLVRLPGDAERAAPGPDRVLTTRVLHVDRYGNCLLDLPASLSASLSGLLRLACAPGAPLVHPVRTYCELPAGALGIRPGSQGQLEHCLDRASAAARLGLRPGSAVVLKPVEPTP